MKNRRLSLAVILLFAGLTSGCEVKPLNVVNGAFGEFANGLATELGTNLAAMIVPPPPK